MLGEKYLVAPVLEKGRVKRKVIFPDGQWRDMTDGNVYGGGRYEVNAPIDKLPYFEKID
jgi:alpha-glucosidase